MTSAEYRTLRGQILLISGLFAVCIVASTVVATQRGFVEQRLAEVYADKFSESVTQAAADLASGRGTAETIRALNAESRLALYDHWMSATAAPRTAPAIMVEADLELYLRRAERSLVCGNLEQKKKALTFFELAASPASLNLLGKARQWAQRRDERELSEAIASSIDRIRNSVKAPDRETPGQFKEGMNPGKGST